MDDPQSAAVAWAQRSSFISHTDSSRNAERSSIQRIVPEGRLRFVARIGTVFM